MLRLLIADGNDRDGRRRRVEAAGATSAEAYARVIREIDPSARCLLATPADADAGLPDCLGLSDFDGVVFTGSSLKIGDRTPAVTRQVDLMRRALKVGLPVFGSCWGLHVATVACGGDVGPNNAASEYAFARGLRGTHAGRKHHLLSGREASWDAPAIHADVVLRPPPGSTVLAENDLVAVQAIEIATGAGTFWGTQYHPELDLDDLAAMLASSAEDIVATAQAPNGEAIRRYADRIAALHGKPSETALAQELGLGANVTEAVQRRTEIVNFLRFVREGRMAPPSRRMPEVTAS